jgi:hypothetical protein
MPTTQLKNLAKETGKSLQTIEKYWDEAKKTIGKDQKDFNDKDWATVFSIVKKRAS